MKRAIAAALVFASLAGGAAFLRLSWAAPAGGCTFPDVYDNLQAVNPGDKLTSGLFNRIMCVLNALQQKALSGELGSNVKTACVPLTNVAAGNRVLVDVAVSGVNLMGTEAAFASVTDTANPSRLEADGIQSRLGGVVKVWVWNRDANTAHSGTVCVEVYPS